MEEKFGSFDSPKNMTDEEKEQYNDLMRDMISDNAESLKVASSLEFNTIDQLQQGASTLQAIVENTVPGDSKGTMLDMEGREAAVTMMEVKHGIKIFYYLPKGFYYQNYRKWPIALRM